MKKFALISTALPPSQSGQSIVLYHLLKDLDPGKFCLITQKNLHLYSIKPSCSSQLSAKYFFLQPDYQIIRIITQLASWIRSTSLLKYILKIRTTQIKKIIMSEHCDGIIACTGDIFDPPAAFNVSKELGIPFILYTFDYYSCHWTDPLLRSFATNYEPDLVQGATEVIVPNECMQNEYLKRYGITSTVIHNPFDSGEYERLAQHMNDKKNIKSHDITIVYTGAIYDAHYGAFRNLITAIKSLENPDITVHLYTPQSQYRLSENSITGPIVVHEAQPVTAIPSIQQNADILFLPLSFDSPYPEIINTAAPGKMGEYLASKRPILVHAPKKSFVSWYFRKYHCGLVVDENDPQLLAQAVQHLINDKELCQKITENAYLRAKTDFDLNTARNQFLMLLD